MAIFLSAPFQNPIKSCEETSHIEMMSDDKIQPLEKSETPLMDSNSDLMLQGDMLQTNVGDIEKQLKDKQAKFNAAMPWICSAIQQGCSSSLTLPTHTQVMREEVH